jgi:hypothetical protein
MTCDISWQPRISTPASRCFDELRLADRAHVRGDEYPVKERDDEWCVVITEQAPTGVPDGRGRAISLDTQPFDTL